MWPSACVTPTVAEVLIRPAFLMGFCAAFSLRSLWQTQCRLFSSGPLPHNLPKKEHLVKKTSGFLEFRFLSGKEFQDLGTSEGRPQGAQISLV